VFWEKWRAPAYLALGAAALVIIILLTPGELQTPPIQVSQPKTATSPNVTKSNPDKVKSLLMSREKLLRSLQASSGISLDSSAQKLLEDSLREEYNRQIKTVKEQE
jgi:ABC-type anion transport system duplicated permease subunit